MKDIKLYTGKGILGGVILFSVLFSFAGQSFAVIDFTQLAPLERPGAFFEDVAVSDYGKVFVLDGRTRRVMVMGYTGQYFGSLSVEKPTALAMGPDGMLYVGSYEDRTVKKVAPGGEVVATLADGLLELPGGMAVGQNNDLYVIDAGTQQIKVFDASGSLVRTIDDAPNLPKDLTVYNDRLFLLDQPVMLDDYGGKIHGARVQVFDLAGNPLNSFGSYGSGNGQFIRVKGITVDGQGRIFVSDSLNRIQAFSSLGTYLGVIEGADNAMVGPRGLAVSADSRLFAASSISSTVYVFGLYGAEGSAPFENQAPVLGTCPGQDVNEGDQVVLNPASPTDPDGDGLFFQWRQTRGTSAPLSDSAAFSPAFTAPQVGPPGDTLTFELTALDMRGLASNPAVCSVTVQNILSGTVSINNGAQYTNQQTVYLSLASEDATLIRLGNDDLEFGPWLESVPSLEWQLSSGDGDKIVRAEFMDIAGETAMAAASIKLDTVPPDIPVFTGIAEDSSLIAWAAVPATSFYRLQYADNSLFVNSVTVSPIYETSYVLPPLANGVWYWRVQALDFAGNLSDWSRTASMMIGTEPVCFSAPDAPAIHAPNYGAEISGDEGRLKIFALRDNEHKKQDWLTQWQVSSGENFAELVVDGIIDPGNNGAYSIPRLALLPDTSYYWRVRYISEEGCNSAWSETSLFDTGAGPVDLNRNGIPDDQEVDVSADLDANMVPDAGQTDIKSLNTQTGRQMGLVVVEPYNAVIEEIAAMDVLCTGKKEGKKPTMLFGLLDFRIRTPYPGDTVRLTVHLSEAAHSKARLYLCDRNNGLVDYSDYSEFSEDRRSIDLLFEDGGTGDADGTGNSVIVGSAGPGIIYPARGVLSITGSIMNTMEGILNNKK